MFDESFTYRYYEDEKRINFKRVEELISKDSIAYYHWKKAKQKNFVVNALLISELGIIAILPNIESNSRTDLIVGLGSLVSIVGSIAFAISRQKSKRRAILRYNSLFDLPDNKKTSSSLKISPSLIQERDQKFSKGITLSLKW